MRLPCIVLLTGLSLTGGTGFTQELSAAQSYQSKCSICHDGGAGQAPRINDQSGWAGRLNKGMAALYNSAIAGVPNTAMSAKGGYVELSDAQVRAIVDYMLQRSGNTAQAPQATVNPSTQKQATPVPVTPARVTLSAAPRSDLALSQDVAARLLEQLGEGHARLDEYQGVITVRGVGIKVSAQSGVVTLAGSVKEGAISQQAEAIATATAGVGRVVNRLIAAPLFEWD